MGESGLVNGQAFSDSKTHAIAEFLALRQQPTPSGSLGGRGYPDHDILAFCDWLNAFDGIYTLQSCAGHRARDGHVTSQGVLWVRLDCELLQVFRAMACELDRAPCIDRIQSIYARHGEFVEIIFRGNECGQLRESLAALTSFFRALVIETTRQPRPSLNP